MNTFWQDFTEGSYSRLAFAAFARFCCLGYNFVKFSSFPFGAQYLSLPVHHNLSEGRMDSTIQSEIERQQSKMLEKMSTIFDNKLETMKRQLEVTNERTKAHEVF